MVLLQAKLEQERTITYAPMENDILKDIAHVTNETNNTHIFLSRLLSIARFDDHET